MQKKLQMRIEAQGKYLQTILEKAQKSLSVEANNGNNVEATRAELSEFNLALSSLIENVKGEERKGGNVVDSRRKICSSSSSYYGAKDDDSNDVKLTVEGGGSINFDLNTRSSSYDFIGNSGAV